MMTPVMVHYDQAPLIRRQRQGVLDAAYQSHPERFVRKPAHAPELQQEVWINKPPDFEEKSH
jgi:putative transposase